MISQELSVIIRVVNVDAMISQNIQDAIDQIDYNNDSYYIIEAKMYSDQADYFDNSLVLTNNACCSDFEDLFLDQEL